MANNHLYLVDDLVKRINFAVTGSTTVDDALTVDARWALEAAIMEWVLATRPQDVTTTGTVTTADGTAEYALPDDFWEMRPNGVRLNASPYTTLRYMTQAEFQRYEFHSITTTGTPVYYAILSRSSSTGLMQIRFLPIPNATLTIKVDYVPLPAKVRDTTSGDGTYIDKRVPSGLVIPLAHRAAVLGFSHMLDAAQIGAFERSWQEALRMSRDTAVKQGGVVAVPHGYDYETDGLIVPPTTVV